MTTKELRAYIDRILGNNIRLLLPSYWWKRMFGATIDKVEEVETDIAYVSTKVTNIEKDIQEIVNKSGGAKVIIVYPSETSERNKQAYNDIEKASNQGVSFVVYASYGALYYPATSILPATKGLTDNVHGLDFLGWSQTENHMGNYTEKEHRYVELYSNGKAQLGMTQDLIIDGVMSDSSENPVQNKAVANALKGKQDTLESGTNIKTINGESILGEGDIVIEGGEGSYDDTEIREEITELSTGVEVLKETKADIDGVYDEMTVGRSAELLGVAEAQEAEITFRPTDGDGSIKDGFASIERVKGETVVWNQKIDLLNLVENGATYAVQDNKLTMTLTDKAVTDRYGGIGCVVPLVVGHVYLIHVDNVKCDEGITRVTFGNLIQGTLYENGSVAHDSIVTAVGSSSPKRVYINTSGELISGTSFSVENLRLTDLTQMFGAGNEPTTIEEFYARIPEGVDLNTYNEGEVVGMTANGLKSVGFNAWDEEWENGRINNNTGELIPSSGNIRSKNYIPVIAGATYYCLGVFTIIYFDKNFQQVDWWSIGGNRILTLPDNVHYMKLYTAGTTYNHDICIHLVHSGYRNGEYEPYEDDVLALPTNDLFPQGMHGINGVVDEYDAEKKIQRIGVVDLGSLLWFVEDTVNPTDLRFFSPSIKSVVNSMGSNSVSNILCSKYQVGTASNTYNCKIRIALKTGGNLSIYDSAYTDDESFKAAMQGVLLYYELAEPVITYHDKPLHLTYKAWDFGTEAMQNDKPSTPLNAEIVYEFNARDTIRANKKAVNKVNANILSLEQRVAQLEALLVPDTQEV